MILKAVGVINDPRPVGAFMILRVVKVLLLFSGLFR